MSVNGITNAAQSYDSKVTAKSNAKTSQKPEDVAQSEQTNADNAAAVYEKSEQPADDKKVYKQDTATIERLKSEAERRNQSLRDLVEKLLLEQGHAVDDSTDIYALLREGKVDVDPETRAQAQKDVAEDGYWGVEQTSDRILSFAKALAGGDPSKANMLIDAVKKGYEQATKAWGGSLPEISQKTLDTALTKLEAWRDGTESE